MSLAQNQTESHTVRMGRPARTVADKQLIAAVGKRLKWVREAMGMKQAQIADLVGVDQTAWSLYERGLRMPDQFAAVRLIAKLKISREYLLEGILENVEPDLAIRLALAHPELAPPRRRARDTDTAQA